jgi:hypothetical protein
VPDPTPPVLPRAALERVLLRAAELHAAVGEAPETMTEAELVAVASEVGISPVALRQALAEERMRVVIPEERGLMAAVAGPATFIAARQVTGTPRDLLAAIDRAFQRDENLMERRRFPDRIVWGARGGLAGAVREFTRFDGRGFPLVKADEVSAAVTDAGQGRTFVRIEASFLERRARTANRTLMGGVAGLATGAALVAMNVFAPLAIAAGVAIAAASAFLVRRGYRRDAAASQLAIEQALDRLEFGEPKKRGLLDQLLSDR